MDEHKEAKIRIGVTCSSQSLVDTARKIANEKNLEFSGAYLGLDDSIPVAKEMEANGIEIILARGATAPLVRQNVRIPVLSFPRTAIDIIQGIIEAADIGHHILLISSWEDVKGINIIESLLNINLTQSIYYNAEDMKNLISNYGDRYDVIVGGASEVRTARKQGLAVVELKTAEEVIKATIESAISVVASNREEQEKTQRFHHIIDAVSDGVVAFNQQGELTRVNSTARELLKIDDHGNMDDLMDDLNRNTSMLSVLQTRMPIKNKLERINQDTFVFTHRPIVVSDKIVGGVSTFKDVSDVVEVEKKVRRSLSKGLVAKYTIDDFLFRSPVMANVVNMAKQFALTNSTILIMGETGTGKEILAQSIHNISLRSKHPFVSINCAALSEQLLESELFGFEEGTFTGSRKGGKPGLFEIAHTGTILLDEIAATTQRVQRNLLRILQEKEVMRIGAERIIPIDVRIITATNRELSEMVKDGHFREDLFYRLNVLRITIPPLRSRLEDISILVQKFIEDLSAENRMAPLTVPSHYLEKLKKYSWPGNVRQLRNFTERLYLMCGPQFKESIFDDLYFELVRFSPDESQKKLDENTVDSLKDQLVETKKSSEWTIIQKALEASNHSKTEAAKRLGISRTTLWKKLRAMN